MLREAGVEVVTGVMEEEVRALNKAFMTLQTKGRPYIILKWAQSEDGVIDRLRMDVLEPVTVLSSPETSRLVHKLRSEVAAIMVGTRTALLDNPSLNVRHWSGNSPVRVVLGSPARYSRFLSVAEWFLTYVNIYGEGSGKPREHGVYPDRFRGPGDPASARSSCCPEVGFLIGGRWGPVD